MILLYALNIVALVIHFYLHLDALCEIVIHTLKFELFTKILSRFLTNISNPLDLER